MDKTTLVKEDILEGKKFIVYLENNNFKVNSALWLYISELNKWKLVIASEYLKTHSIKDAYNFIQNGLKNANVSYIELDNISIVNVDDDLIKLLKFAVQTGNTISEIRFTQNVINGILIEDALIYKIN